MGLFSKHGGIAKLAKKAGKTASKTVGNLTELIGDSITNPTETIGKVINDVTGVTSSARQQIDAQKQLQSMAQNFNAEQANIERNWQEEMSNTARQRAVEDSQKAGVNPILAAGGSAAGASSGAGAAATSSTGQAGTGTGQNPISMIAELIKASNNTAKTQAEIKNIDADTKLKEQTHKNGGNGGTSFTRTMGWTARQVKNAQNKIEQKEKEWINKGKNLSWTDFKKRLGY